MKETVNLYIDGRRIFADQGTTILEAARQNGIYIPTLCYHPRLEPLGHCRICIVKIEGIERPITSCDNPVSDGMIVLTDTPELQSMRSQILELSLSTHPYQDCLTCVRTGTCELQEKAYQYQVDLPEQLDRDISSEQSDDNPEIIRDEAKCILCGRCIQVCRSGPGRSVYSMVGNGVNTRVVPFRNGREVSMEEAGCIFCGQCVDVCPVAALTEKGRTSGGREWELSRIPGVCIDCSLGCYLERQASGENLIKITVPVEGDKVSWLCRKGKFGFKKESEVTNSMKLAQGGYTETDYKDAINNTAERILNLKENFGSSALAVLACGQLSNEENYLLQKLARKVIGTPNLDLGAEPSWATAINIIKTITGTGIYGPTPASIRNAETIFIIGSGLEESHPVAAMAVGQAGRFGGAVIIRTDAAPEDAAAWESIYLKHHKGGYNVLLNAMSIFVENENAAGTAKKAGISVGLLKEVTDLITAKNSYTIVCPSFFEKADQRTIEALVAMAQFCGQIGRGKNNLLLLSRFSNASGVLAAGGTTLGGFGISETDENKGLNREEIISAAENGRIKGLLLFGGSFAGIKPGGLDFIMVLCSAEKEVPRGADFIFPAQPVICKNGMFTNSAGQTRFNEPVLTQAPSLMQDWRFINDLARALGAKWHYTSVEDIREEMKGLISAY